MPFKLKYNTVYVNYMTPTSELSITEGATGNSSIMLNTFNVFKSAVGSTGSNHIGQLTVQSVFVPNGDTGTTTPVLVKAHNSIYMYEQKLTIDYDQFVGHVITQPLITPGTVNTLKNKYPIIMPVKQVADANTRLVKLIIGKEKLPKSCEYVVWY